MDLNGWPLMQFKYFCIHSDWFPKVGGGIRLRNKLADRHVIVPRGDPLAFALQRGKAFDEVCKVIDGFINLWGAMANKDLFGEFWRMHEPLSYC